MPADKTIDFMVMFLVIGLLVLGIGSWLVGWLVKQWDRFVNRSQVVMTTGSAQTGADEQTDDRQTQVSEADQWLDRLEVDRTKTALIELLVYSGWDVGQIRNVIKGDNGAIGIEVEAAKHRLGIILPPRELRVRDEKGERLIPMEG